MYDTTNYLAPDFGIFWQQKHSARKNWRFNGLIFINIGRTADDSYTISTRFEEDGVMYQVSLDFGVELLNKIVAKAPAKFHKRCFEILAGPFNGPSFLELERFCIVLTGSAKLGEHQSNINEQYIPFVLKRIEPENIAWMTFHDLS